MAREGQGGGEERRTAGDRAAAYGTIKVERKYRVPGELKCFTRLVKSLRGKKDRMW